MRFLLVAGFPDSILTFRGPLIRTLLEVGLEVHIACPDLPHCSIIRMNLERMGLTVHDVPLKRAGTNPIADLELLWRLFRLMWRVRPEFFLGYTIKPVIYGSIAAWLVSVPHRFALITGLGYAFTGERSGLLKNLIQWLYRFALCRVQKVFFQNPDDEFMFRTCSILTVGTRSCVVNGSGVDVASFRVAPLPMAAARFLLIARLLGDKGVREYAQAARRIHRKYPATRFALVGWLDENPDAIKRAELEAWVADGTVDYLGRLADVRSAIANCNVYVLPSYREGLPRTVLEAMAMGRPVITTDTPGCRETVVDGDNGFLVPIQSVDALVTAMERFILEPALIQRMGKRSRQIAEGKYDVHKVNAVMLKEMGIQ